MASIVDRQAVMPHDCGWRHRFSSGWIWARRIWANTFPESTEGKLTFILRPFPSIQCDYNSISPVNWNLSRVAEFDEQLMECGTYRTNCLLLSPWSGTTIPRQRIAACFNSWHCYKWVRAFCVLIVFVFACGCVVVWLEARVLWRRDCLSRACDRPGSRAPVQPVHLY